MTPRGRERRRGELWVALAARAFAGAAACSDSTAADDEQAAALAAIVLQSQTGEALPLSSFRADASDSRRLLVLRVGASWCGPCRWHAAHGGELVAAAPRDAVAMVDVLVRGQDNAAPTAADFADWSARVAGAAELAADRDYALAQLFPARSALPQIAFIDRRDLRVLGTVSGSSPSRFEAALADALRSMHVEPSTRTLPAPALHDGRFTRDQWDMIRDMRLAASAAPDPSNAYADDAAAAALGQRLFFSTQLTPARAVSCASCHVPELLFQDGKDQPPEGVGIGVRNVPTIVLAPEQRWQFWDGRADSSWSQAVMPLEDPDEIASSRLFVAHAVKTQFASDYEAVFGALPLLDDGARFPAQGRPGDDAWSRMTDSDRAAVNRVFANVGKAIAAYERSLRPLPNALDRYAAGDTTALNDDEKAGLEAFFGAGCAQCHYGPQLRDESFHVLGFPTGHPDRSPDPGRLAIVSALGDREFSRTGAFSDQVDAAPELAAQDSLLGAFKTPGLRGVGFTLPCGHGGSFGGLAGTLDAHRTPSVAAGSSLSSGEREPWLVDFDPAATPQLVTFLKALRVELPASGE